MGKNKRRRRKPQHPAASKARPSPYERISFDEGFRQLLPVCSPHKAAGRLHMACVEEDDCDLWCDGKLQDRNYIKSLRFEPWLAADGCWRLKITKGVDAINTDGSRSFVIDKSVANWEVS